MLSIAGHLLLLMQAAQAALTGQVTDAEGGQPVGQATVVLTDLDRAVLTDSLGRYSFLAVPAGPQHLLVRRIGFAQRTLHVLVPAQGTLDVAVALRRLPVMLQQVDVRPVLAVRGVEEGDDAAFPDREMSLAAVRNQPLLAEPDVFLALGGGEVQLRPESPGGLHVRGSSADHTAYLVDGIPIFSPFHTALTFSALNPDALESIELASTSHETWFPDALAAVVHARTRRPAPFMRSSASASSTHLRGTIDGPVGSDGSSYLFSIRSTFPGSVSPASENSYLRGESGDLLGRLQMDLPHGELRILGYDSYNDLAAAATANSADQPAVPSVRNEFAWNSRTIGATWTTQLPTLRLQVRAWRAGDGADVLWRPADADPLKLRSRRREVGSLALLESAEPAAFAAGVWLRKTSTGYETRAEPDRPADEPTPMLSLHSSTVYATAFASRGVTLNSHTSASAALALNVVEGHLSVSPHANVRWSPSAWLTLAGSFLRTRQFTQSLRNPESLVTTLFPAELHVGPGAGVPEARGDQLVVAAAFHPAPGRGARIQLYQRKLGNLLLVAPVSGDPFATDSFASGRGTVSGVAVEGAVTSSRIAVSASYGWQRARLLAGGADYTPEYSARHFAEAGVVLFPSATFSIRSGAALLAGRRTTTVSGALEWESCNLLDRGCEFGGSPRYDLADLGASSLPAYVRADVSMRKHWHVRLGSRDAQLTAYATVTNLFGRNNVLSLATGGVNGDPARITMRPFAPLVIGFDWSY